MRNEGLRGFPVMSALLAAILLAGTPQAAFAQQRGGPTKVIVSEVKSERISDRVDAIGTLRANESIQVTSTVSERILSLGFDDGDQVEAGQTLAVLESDEEQANLKAAEATLAEREANYERTKQLAARSFASKANLEEGLANLLQARATVDQNKARLREREIKAPFSGVVGLRTISPGALVEPGDVITTLDDISVVKLDFSVPSSYLATLAPGLEIRARSSAFPQEVFQGEVSSVSTQIDPVTRSITARAIIPNEQLRLRPGLLMTVTLFKNPREALVVPEEALVPTGRQNFVFVVDRATGNTAEKREVTIGTRLEGKVEVLSGLEHGELIVTHGTIKVRPGQPVEIMTEEQGEETLGEMLERSKQGS
jgi:membrane fusion protein (multidrug efflux system)